MPKVSTQVYMLDRKISKFFRPCRNRRKRAKCDKFFCLTSDFFDFFLIIPLPTMWILLTKPMQKYVTTVCLHCSFARLKNKHMVVLGTNVATISWLHWSPVSGYSSCYDFICNMEPSIPKYRHYDIAYCYIIVPNKSHTLCCRRKEASFFQAF